MNLAKIPKTLRKKMNQRGDAGYYTKEKIKVTKACILWELYQRFLAKELAKEIVKQARESMKPQIAA